MSQPFSGVPDPGFSRRMRRRFQPSAVQETLRRALRGAQHHCEDLWLRGKRNPRKFAIIGGAVALTLVGAYGLSASGAGRSVCPPQDGQKPEFLLLMDPVSDPAARSELKIHYDVCGLPSGTPYRGRVRLSQPAVGKKMSAKPKPLVITFDDKVNGVATRRRQPLDLSSTKPGAYTLELSIVDNQGRERKRTQKISIK